METLTIESLPERIKPGNDLEFIYDDFVWVVNRKGYHNLGVFASEALADQCIADNKHSEGLVKERWPITRCYGEIPRQTRTMGQASNSN